MAPPAAHPVPAILSLGLRPFFLLAGLFAALAIPLYLALIAGSIGSATAPVSWHAHEMLFGYAAAVLSGFLLTAVPNWTASAPVRGLPLACLVGLWLVGRIAFWFVGAWPAWAVAADLLHFPLLAGLVLPALIKAGNRRNYVFIALLGALTLANGAIHAANGGLLGEDWGRRGQFLALDIFVLMVGLIGGRIVPAFTANWLRQQNTAPPRPVAPLAERAALLALAAVALCDLALGDRSPIVGAVCLAAGLLAAWRLAHWRGLATMGEPIVWVLHLGYGWLAAGLMLRGLDNLFGLLVGAAGLHALTVGAIGTMTLAVMSRAGLGHTGQALRAGPLLVGSYLLVNGAALARLVGGLGLGIDYGLILHLSGGLWSLAFLAFLAAMAPSLLRARHDGAPG